MYGVCRQPARRNRRHRGAAQQSPPKAVNGLRGLPRPRFDIFRDPRTKKRRFNTVGIAGTNIQTHSTFQ